MNGKVKLVKLETLLISTAARLQLHRKDVIIGTELKCISQQITGAEPTSSHACEGPYRLFWMLRHLFPHMGKELYLEYLGSVQLFYICVKAN